MTNPNDRVKEGDPDGRPKARREISGPGAADFIAAPGGLDMPENDLSKGTGVTRDEGIVGSMPLVPNLDEPDSRTEREILQPPGKRGEDKR
jgi:hypothetical protein